MSNHLGDTNKMVETPRTETYVLNPLPQVVSAEWARQLERELNAAHESLLYAKGIHIRKQIALDKANDRIKRLEEAGDNLHFGWIDGYLDPRCLDEWRKAKEDKP